MSRPRRFGSASGLALFDERPLWVKSGHFDSFRQCLLYPRKRTSEGVNRRSAKCQKRTSRGSPGLAKRQI
jgi:hypothetical protein